MLGKCALQFPHLAFPPLRTNDSLNVTPAPYEVRLKAISHRRVEVNWLVRPLDAGVTMLGATLPTTRYACICSERN